MPQGALFYRFLELTKRVLAEVVLKALGVQLLSLHPALFKEALVVGGFMVLVERLLPKILVRRKVAVVAVEGLMELEALLELHQEPKIYKVPVAVDQKAREGTQ